MSMSIVFDNSYARLPERFFARINPVPVVEPRLLKFNENLARELGLDTTIFTSGVGVEVLAGNVVPEGAEPIAQAYAGQQFGNWVPQLGDGRAVLLGEVVAPDGRRFDLQLKGSGRTPWSRRGDGRAWLGPVLREYIVSEAMAALGIPTTRALAAVTTGERVQRERAYPGAVLTRVAASHIRVGTFQYFAARQDVEALQLLTDYTIDRHYPEVRDAERPALAFLTEVIVRQAELVARWMGVGFIHGVMNTDNVAISGETIDFGPCAFVDTYHPDTVFSSIDQFGRYAYANQPKVAAWNMAQLASAILPLIDPDEAKAIELATQAVHKFADYYDAAWKQVFQAKIGLPGAEPQNAQLVQELLDIMAKGQADFTRTFRALSGLADAAGSDEPARCEFVDPTAFDVWAKDWRVQLVNSGVPEAKRQAAMQAANPAFIPRNHRVEEVIQAALNDDLAPFERLLLAVLHPYADQPDMADLQAAPEPDEVVRQTFCGT